MATAGITMMMNGDTLTAMKYLDDVARHADVHLLANERMRYSQSVWGRGRSAGRSTLSKSSRRLTPRRRIVRPFMSESAARIATLHSSSEKKR